MHCNFCHSLPSLSVISLWAHGTEMALLKPLCHPTLPLPSFSPLSFHSLFSAQAHYSYLHLLSDNLAASVRLYPIYPSVCLRLIDGARTLWMTSSSSQRLLLPLSHPSIHLSFLPSIDCHSTLLGVAQSSLHSFFISCSPIVFVAAPCDSPLLCRPSCSSSLCLSVFLSSHFLVIRLIFFNVSSLLLTITSLTTR